MKAVTVLSILLLLAPTTPSLGSPTTDTRLEGMVLGFDGHPATGYYVHLIDETGVDAARAEDPGSGEDDEVSDMPCADITLACPCWATVDLDNVTAANQLL